MKMLSEYIQELQEFLKEHGDMPAFYASDDEGNSYQTINYSGSILYTLDPNEYRPDMYCQEDLGELEEDGCELTKVCIVN